jgi:Zn-dependent protease
MGVPIFVTPSWVLVATFITVTYAGLLQDRISGLTTAASYALAFAFAVALALSVLAHELGHTAVSRLLGVRVARIVVFLLGGVSEIEGQPSRPRDEFAIAAAGPLVSFVLAGGLWSAAAAATAGSATETVLGLLAWSNLVVAVFNVLPGLPLDGGRLVQAAIWATGRSRSRAAVVAAWSGRVVAVAVAAGVLVLSASSGDRQHGAVTVGAAAMGFAIAAFLWLGASQTLAVTELAARTADLQLGGLVRPAQYLPATMPVSEALRRTHQSGARAIVIVDAEGRSRALVEEAAVIALPPAKHPWTTLAEVARPLETGLLLSDSLSGQGLLDAMGRTPAAEYLVLDRNGVTRGVLAATDVAERLGVGRAGQGRGPR